MTNPNSRPKIVVVPSSPGVESLVVRVTRSLTNASNGVEYQSGQSYGFERASAVSIVTNDAGLGFCFDEAAGDKWMAAMLPLIDAGKLTPQGALDMLVGPPLDKMRADKAALHDSMERAEELLAAEDAAAKAKAEAEAKAAAIEADAEARAQEQREAEAKRKAKELDEQLTANNDANERRSEPVDASRTVSNANVNSDTAELGVSPPAPPTPKTSARRGR